MVLVEIRVENLGIVEELSLEFGPGMTAITGETGAGKTLLVTALGLLLGGRAAPDMVREGAEQARVDGRFLHHGEELVLSRVVALNGRSRAYIDGRPVTAGQLADIGAELVDLHGQHSHQSLLDVAAQRSTVDHYAGAEALTCLDQLKRLRAQRADAQRQMNDAGGDERTRARELDLLRFQIDEIEGARIAGPDEDESLAAEEDLLAEADAHRHALGIARNLLESTTGDAVGAAVAEMSGREAFADIEERLRALQAEALDVASDLRRRLDDVRTDPERLDAVRARRAGLRELCRKYGSDLAEVQDFAVSARARMEEISSHDERVAELARIVADIDAQCDDVSARLSALRRAAAPAFAAAVGEQLRELAMPTAELVVSIEDAPLSDSGADALRFLLAPNPGEPARPLDKAASGGELSRTMLAIRVVLSQAPPVLVFDEVDAGIGGEAGVAVGRALARLAEDHQVLVVTHLAQVAACADSQIAVAKSEHRGRTHAAARVVGGEERIDELTRMLAGSDVTDTSRRYAAELLDSLG